MSFSIAQELVEFPPRGIRICLNQPLQSGRGLRPFLSVYGTLGLRDERIQAGYFGILCTRSFRLHFHNSGFFDAGAFHASTGLWVGEIDGKRLRISAVDLLIVLAVQNAA